MDYGVTLYPFTSFGGLEEVTEFVCTAERLGYAYVLIPDHAIVGAEQAEQMGALWWDPLVLAAHLASRTTHIRLSFGILVLPHYHPVHLARAIATLDHVSGGRIDVGIGVGWLEEEFDAMGVPFRERGARADEYIDILRVLWTAEVCTHHGRFYSFTDARVEPKPLQSPHPPIWVGGTIEASLKRAAARGDAWQPMSTSIDELELGLDLIKAQLEQSGRAEVTLPVQGKVPLWETSERATIHAREAGTSDHAHLDGNFDVAREQVLRASAIGVTRMWVELPLEATARNRELERFAADFIQS